MPPNHQTIQALYICPNGFIGGAERFVLDINLQHQGRGKINSRIFFLNDGPALDWCRAKNVNFHLLPFTMRLSRPLSVLRATRYLRAYLLANHIDLIHATMAYSHIIGALASYGLSIKKTWFQHGPVGQKLDLLADTFSCDHLFFNSCYLQSLHAHFAIKSGDEAQSIIPMGIRHLSPCPQKVAEIKKQYKQNSRLLVTAGRISSFKGLETIFLAMALLKKNRPTFKYTLLVLGAANSAKDQAYLRWLQNLVQEQNLGGDIFFLGHQERVEDYIRAADYFIHSSKFPEPFGIAIAEAMSLGAIAIASVFGGVGDYLIDGKTGFSFDSLALQASEHLYQKIISIEQNFSASSLQKIASNAQNLIHSKYHIDNTANALEAIYQKLCPL